MKLNRIVACQITLQVNWNELNHSNSNTVDGESVGGYVEHVVMAEFQADSYMATQIIDHATIMVMSKDSDIPIINHCW